MYEKTKQIDSFFIAGFQYHEGAEALSKLKPGTKIDIVPEFDNPYDSNALALKYKGKHLGYVPRVSNSTLAQLIYFGHTDVVKCRVVQRNQKADPREQVRVSLYIKDKRK